MRAVIQRVSRARVTVHGEITGEIERGLLVLIGIASADTESDADYLAGKIAGLRIFEDEQGKMNLSLADVGGSMLAVSQFTLYGDVRHGRRPSFDAAATPEKARGLYEYLVELIRASWSALRNRQVRGDDAGRAGQRRPGDYPAGFIESLLEIPSAPAFAGCTPSRISSTSFQLLARRSAASLTLCGAVNRIPVPRKPLKCLDRSSIRTSALTMFLSPQNTIRLGGMKGKCLASHWNLSANEPGPPLRR